jgi:hypothetical protein
VLTRSTVRCHRSSRRPPRRSFPPVAAAPLPRAAGVGQQFREREVRPLRPSTARIHTVTGMVRSPRRILRRPRTRPTGRPPSARARRSARRQ